ncbi:MAG: tRNA (5-methylaminomethyl-2-thiouridine)(34)-methyltransferase MnmD [Saprospiraceae bacterium]
MINHQKAPVLGPDDVYSVSTLDGSNTLYSRKYQATYHSINGAVSESMHVFIQHCLNLQLHLPHIRILEIGFGTGLNAFLSFLFSRKHNISVQYLGIDPYPISIEIARSLDYPSYLAASVFENVFLRMHDKSLFVQDGFSFEKRESFSLKNVDGPFDCIYFDAFDPVTQPELWSLDFFQQLFNATSSGGCLSTYCAKGEIRRFLIQSGYTVERIPGAPGKRQMISATKP